MELVDTDDDADVSDEQLAVQLRTVDYIDQFIKVDDVTDPIADTKNVFLARFVDKKTVFCLRFVEENSPDVCLHLVSESLRHTSCAMFMYIVAPNLSLTTLYPCAKCFIHGE